MNMKALFLCLTLGCLVAAPAAAEVRPHPDWTNSLKPDGQPGPRLVLAQAGKPRCTIVLPTKPTPQEKNAASELSTWLGKIIGAAPRIVNEPLTPRPAGTLISIGRTRLLASSKVKSAKADLGDEGFGIAADDGALYLFGGRTRGPIYAVYALLEEDLGCRWYAGDSATVPTAPGLTIAAVPRTYVPKLEVRDPYWREAVHVRWSRRNRTNSYNVPVGEDWGGHVDYAHGWFVHTFDKLVPYQKYFKDHPEYFSEVKGKRVHVVPGHRPGQLCLTNPEVVRIATEKVLEVLGKNPEAELISVSENDGRFGQCTCKSCRQVNRPQGTPAAALVLFVNAVAEAVADKHPRVKVTTLAYGGTTDAPTSIKPRRNVVIRLCTDTHAWPYPFRYITESERFIRALRGWSNLESTIHIWDYTTNFGAYLKPWPNMSVVQVNIRKYIEHGARGVMLQGAYQSPGADRSDMRAWVWAKQLYYPQLEVEPLMKDFVFGYYGAAAEPVWQYNRMLLDVWTAYHNDLPEKRTYPVTDAHIRRGMQLFDKALELAADNPELLERVEKASLSVLYARLEMGPDNAVQVPTYLGWVDLFEALARKYHVTHLRERPRGIEQYLLTWRARAGRMNVTSPPGAVVADDIGIRLARHLKDQSARVVEDKLADNGYAVKQPGANTSWSIQYDIPVDKLEKGRTYEVRIRVRADKTGDKGAGLRAGVYNPKTRKYTLKPTHVSADKLSEKEYRWFSLGRLVPEARDIVYIAPQNNPENIAAVYTDRIELVPVEAE